MQEDQLYRLLKDIAVNSDRQAYKKLYMAYYNKFFSLAKLFTRSIEGAEEIVDDTFLFIWLKRAQLLEINNFNAYVVTAIKNQSLNYIAKTKRAQQHLNLDDLEIDIADLSLNGEGQLILNDLSRSVNQSVAKLPEQCRVVFKLVKEDGYKYKEVAELLSISVKTVEYHIGNALKKIAKDISPAPKPVLGEPQKIISK